MAASEDPTDDELLTRIAAGDRDAFAALYRRRRPDVYRFALHLGGSPPVADDVTQDVFMDVIHHARRYEPGRSSVVAWLLGITRNHLRRHVDRQRPTVTLPDRASQHLSVDADPLAAVARREDAARLRRALLELPSQYREAVVLCDLQELSYVDAAATIGCAVGTVRSRLHRGRSLLARKLRRGDSAPVPSAAARWLL